MYSEAEDFAEKEKAFSDMTSCLSNFAGNDWEEMIKGGMALEIGGSGGLLGGMISNLAGRVICTDIIDTQLQYDGQFAKLLKEKFERNGRSLDLGKIEFHVADAQDLIYRENYFDLVFTQNALEHIPDPLVAIKESLRVLKPGGILYATFDPVWTADSGSHFLDFVKDPWLHIILSDDEFCSRMRKGGAQDWQLTSYRKDMNRLPCAFYRDQVPMLLENAKITKYKADEWSGCVNPSFVNHRNRNKAAKILNCDSSDLLVRGFCFLVVK